MSLTRADLENDLLRKTFRQAHPEAPVLSDADQEASLRELLERLDRENHAVAVEIASVPEHIRGYGHVKRRHLDGAKKRETELLAQFRAHRSTAKAA